MLPILATFAYLLAAASSAPTPGAQPLLTQQYVILQPPAAAQHQQLHYEPVYKLQQPLFQQITPLGSLETPQKQQLLVLYPNGPLTQFPLISLRQTEGGNTWENFQTFFQNLFTQPPGSGKFNVICFIYNRRSIEYQYMQANNQKHHHQAAKKKKS